MTMRERIAKLLYERRTSKLREQWEILDSEHKEDWFGDADAVLAELREPTSKMLYAARLAEHDHFFPHMGRTEHTWTSLSSALVAKLWRAMIDDAKGEKP